MSIRENRKPILYLLPVPLGDTDVERVLPSANIDLIQSLDYFIVEDERSARRFLRKAGYIKDLDPQRFQVLNEHSRDQDIPMLTQWIMEVGLCGLLSESGLPCIADPGAGLVQAARTAGIQIKAMSGPSSIFLALMSSGFDGQRFSFHGYLPIDKKVRAMALLEMERAARSGRGTQVFMETPYRNVSLLADILKVCSPDTLLCVAVDLTLETEWIHSAPISAWKKENPNIHKRLAVFLISG